MKTRYRLSELVKFPEKKSVEGERVDVLRENIVINEAIDACDKLVEWDVEGAAKIIYQASLNWNALTSKSPSHNIAKYISENLPKLIKEVNK